MLPLTLDLRAGTRLGPYEITVQIGKGGMGEVYRARHEVGPNRENWKESDTKTSRLELSIASHSMQGVVVALMKRFKRAVDHLVVSSRETK